MEKKQFIGIDISKLTFDVAVYIPGDKSHHIHNRLANTPKGFAAFLRFLHAHHLTEQEVHVCLENTGLYSISLCSFFESRDISYTLLAPVQMKRSVGIQRGKTDKDDALRLAYYGWLHREELTPGHLPAQCLLHLQELVSERERNIKARKAYKQIVSERELHPLVCTIRRAEEMIKHLDEFIAEIEQDIRNIIAGHQEIARNYELLLSVPGIAFVNAINTIIHTRNFSCFTSARKYACYIGVAPFRYQSGTSVRGRTRVGELGAKALKADLTQGARSAVQWNPEFKRYYKRKEEEGKVHGVIMNAVKFKIIERMFAVVRRETPYANIMAFAG